jgi:multicomponent K+:H+ antiporter subunit G
MTLETLPAWAALPAALLLILGGLCTAIGSLGLARLGSFYQRMHAPAMGNTLGTGCVLIASMLVSTALANRLVVHEILITVFIVITAPMTSMLLMRAAVHRSNEPTGRLPGDDHAGRLPDADRRL